MDSASHSGFKLEISGEGLALSRTIDSATLRLVLNIVFGGTLAAAIGSDLPDDGHSSDAVRDRAGPRRAPLSLREYLNATGAKRYPEKILVIARFIEEHEERSSFTRDDIRARFRVASEPPPGNFARDFSVATGSGWIAEDPANKGQFYVTHSGQLAIESSFSADAPRASKSRPNRRRRSSAMAN